MSDIENAAEDGEVDLETRVGDLSEEVEALRAGLIRQEHRVVPLWLNFLKYRKAGLQKEKSAARVALLWWLFRPGTVAIGGTGLIAAITLMVAWQSNAILKEQTGVFERQTAEMASQSTLFREQLEQRQDVDRAVQRADLLRVLYDERCTDPVKDSEDQITKGDCVPAHSARARSEAFAAFVSLEESTASGAGEEQAFVYLSRALLQGTSLNGPASSNVWLVLNEANLSGAFLHGNFNQTFLTAADCSGANISGDLSNSVLQGANFAGARLVGVGLSSAVVRGADFTDANLDYADLRGAKYDLETRWPSDLDPAARGAILLDADWREIGVIDGSPAERKVRDDR